VKFGLEAVGESPYLLANSTTVEQLAEQAMSLPGESRARLADILVESLDADTPLTQIDRLWLSEAKRRRDEVRAGKVKTISGDETLRRVRDSLRRWRDDERIAIRLASHPQQ
jgi:hypothetical protein